MKNEFFTLYIVFSQLVTTCTDLVLFTLNRCILCCYMADRIYILDDVYARYIKESSKLWPNFPENNVNEFTNQS